MYACNCETGRGFFEEVCAPGNATTNFRDPPPPWKWTCVNKGKRKGRGCKKPRPSAMAAYHYFCTLI